MKTIKLLKKRYTAVYIAFFTFVLTTNFSCEDELCEALALADLVIPTIVELADQYGNPLINQNTGQQVYADNELYYNRRTGEYFNNDFPPTQGLQVNDVIDIATNIFNSFNDSVCGSGATSAPSITGPTLSVNGPFFNGMVSLQGMPTASIPQNQRETTATSFVLATPGSYKVDFNANAPRNIQEHSYDNNFYNGQNGNYSKNSFTFQVSGEPLKLKENISEIDFYDTAIIPTTVEQVKNTHLYKFINSKEFGSWYLMKLEKQ